MSVLRRASGLPDLAKIGAAMSAEWSAAAGANGAAIIDAFKAN